MIIAQTDSRLQDDCPETIETLRTEPNLVVAWNFSSPYFLTLIVIYIVKEPVNVFVVRKNCNSSAVLIETVHAHPEIYTIHLHNGVG